MPFVATLRPRTLTGRFLLLHTAAVLGVLLFLGLVVDRVVERAFVDQLTQSLEADARAVGTSLPAAHVEDEVRSLAGALGARITVIRTDGVVVADSERDASIMDNHRDRPEVRQALRGTVGVSSRFSTTVGTEFRYVAIPPLGGRIVRVALPLDDVASRLTAIRLLLLAGFVTAALGGLGVLVLISRGLSRPLERIAGAVERVGHGDLSAAVPEEGTEELAALAATVNRMRTEVARRIEDLERERETRDAILSALTEGVALFDRDGAVVYGNDHAGRMVGPLTTAGRLPEPLRGLVVRAGQGTAGAAEAEVGPEPRIVAATAVAVPGGGVLLVLRDVTRARAVEAVRRDFVANASHELKTPVASIRALAETIGAAAGDDPGSVGRFAAQLEREAVRLSRIVSDLLDLSRLESTTGDRFEVRLDSLVAGEVERHRERADRMGVALDCKAAGPVMIQGSPRDLGLLVANLVENAIDNTRSGGRVEVSVRGDDGSAVLEVRDTGVGIPMRDRGRVFERFFRVDRARSRETGGTGLGLSIVRHVVDNHGGTVSLASEVGRGSTFTITLPAAGRPAG